MPPYGASPQPGQPPYGAQPYGAPPYGAPPIGTPPPKKKRTVLWVFLALGLVAIVAIGALVALGIAGTKDDVLSLIHI